MLSSRDINFSLLIFGTGHTDGPLLISSVKSQNNQAVIENIREHLVPEVRSSEYVEEALSQPEHNTTEESKQERGHRTEPEVRQRMVRAGQVYFYERR